MKAFHPLMPQGGVSEGLGRFGEEKGAVTDSARRQEG